MHRSLALLACLLALACSPPNDAPTQPRSVSQQEVLELSQAPDAAVILDVRSPEEYRAGHVPNAINIPFDQVAARIDELADVGDRTLVVYCERGGRATKAEAALHEAGFADVAQLEGHMSAWKQAGLPTEAPGQ